MLSTSEYFLILFGHRPAKVAGDYHILLNGTRQEKYAKYFI